MINFLAVVALAGHVALIAFEGIGPAMSASTIRIAHARHERIAWRHRSATTAANAYPAVDNRATLLAVREPPRCDVPACVLELVLARRRTVPPSVADGADRRRSDRPGPCGISRDSGSGTACRRSARPDDRDADNRASDMRDRECARRRDCQCRAALRDCYDRAPATSASHFRAASRSATRSRYEASWHRAPSAEARRPRRSAADLRLPAPGQTIGCQRRGDRAPKRGERDRIESRPAIETREHRVKARSDLGQRAADREASATPAEKSSKADHDRRRDSSQSRYDHGSRVLLPGPSDD